MAHRTPFHLHAPRDLLARTPFARLEGQLTLKALDVGVRDGFDTLLTPIAPLVDFVGLDPDAAEVERLEQQRDARAPRWHSERMHPIALGRPAAGRTLHLTHSPACSSLLPPNLAVTRRYAAGRYVEPTGTTHITPIALDDALAQLDLEDLAFLKMDIQGAELEVLETGPKCLGNTLLMIRAEEQFLELYKGRPTHGDIERHLTERGFYFAGFEQLYTWRLSETPKTRATSNSLVPGDVCHFDGIYLRQLEWFEDGTEASARTRLNAALLALAWGRSDYAAAVLEPPTVRDYLADTWHIDRDRALTQADELIASFWHRKRLGQALLGVWDAVRDQVRARR